MAEEPKSKRRLVKKVETVREKAVKASEEEQQPRRLHKTRRRAGAPFRAIGRGGRKLNKVKPFRILGFIIVPPYFRNSWRELRQVNWPSFKLAVKLTFAVIAFAVVFGIVIAIIDFGLDKLFKQVLLK